MAEEFETVELEISEDDILYYLVDEDGNEVGFVIEEDGAEIECYYDGIDGDQYEVVEEVGGLSDAGSGPESLAELDGETVELEISEDDIEAYLVDEDGNEIGFVIIEDGVEIECYYEEDEPGEAASGNGAAAASKPAEAPEEPKERGYLGKIASIAGYEGNKARKKAEKQLDKVRGKAEVGVDKATAAVQSGGKRLKEKKDEYDLGITREGVAEATSDLNAIAKEGAETAKELKEAYDDIMDSFGFLVPKKVRRKLP